MQLITDLGINHTLWYHLAIFIFAYLSLNTLLFKPYSQALAVRNEQTKGGEALAQDLMKEYEDLEDQYQTKLRDLNEQIDSIFDRKKKEALSKEEQILSAEKSSIDTKYKEFQSKLSEFKSKTSKDLELETPKMANLITSKLLE